MSASQPTANGFEVEDIRTEPVPLPELPDHPTPGDLARAYGSVVIVWSRYWPKLAEGFHWLYGVVMGTRGIAERIDSRLSRIEERLNVGSLLPPMRPELSSTHDMARAVGHDVAARYEAEARNPSTPPPTGTTVAEMVADRVQVELLKIKAAELEKREVERRESEALANRLKDDKAKAMRKLWISVGTTGLAIVVAIVDHFLR